MQFYSSQEYPLDYAEDVPNGAYFKDLNGELDKYVGVWVGNWNGKTVYLEIKKVKDFFDGIDSYYKDKLYGERKIVNSNGVVEIDRITNFDLQNSEFSGLAFNLLNQSVKRLYFHPKNMCGMSASIDITAFESTIVGGLNNPNSQIIDKMTLHLEYLPSFEDPNCIHNAYVAQYDAFPINFPKDIILTKQ